MCEPARRRQEASEPTDRRPRHARGCRPRGLIYIQQVRSIERFYRTLADGWAFRRLYTGESQRRTALPGWLREYNHHRPHTALGRHPSISRLTNLSDQYT